MKIFLLSVLFIGIAYSCSAQVDPYTLAVGINSISYQHMPPQNGSGVSTTAEAIADVNFFLKHNWSVYAGVGYNYGKETDDNYYNPDGIPPYVFIRVNAITKGVPFNIGARKWLPVKALNNRLAFIGDVSFNAEMDVAKYHSVDNTYTVPYHDNLSTLTPQISPGIAVFITNHLSIECLMGGFGYMSQTDKTVYTNVTPNSNYNNQQFYINLTPENWRLGINYFFGKGMQF